MKIIRACAAFLFILLLFSYAYAQEAYRKNTEIVYSETCPEGCIPAEGKLTLGVGETVAVLTEIDKIASSDAAVLNVMENNTAEALKPGNAVLRTYFEDGSFDDINITVKKAPVSVSLSRSSGFMNVGSTYQLTHSLSKNSAGTVVWSSSDTNILTVDQTGFLTAFGAGECVITVKTYNGLSAECIVQVKMPAPAEVKLSASSGVMFAHETHQLACTLKGGYMETVSWSSDNEDVVTVSEDGLLTAHSEGKAVITAAASGGNSAECVVTVKPASTAITLKESAVSLYENGRISVKPDIEGGSGKYSMYSMDESILVIDEETNEIVAERTGEAYVLFITPNYLIAECLVRVVPAPETLMLSASETVFAEGENARVFLNPGSFEPLPVAYASANTAVASVSEDGVILGIAPGKTVISAASGGLHTETEIEILPIADSIRLTGGKNLLGIGDTVHLSAHLTGGSGRVTYLSDNPSVALADPVTGLITAAGQGECLITASLVNGLKAVYPITVVPAPKSFSLDTTAVILGTGDAHALSWMFDEGASATITFESSDESVFSMENGLITAGENTGEALLTARTHNGLTASMHITVLPPPESIQSDVTPLTSHDKFDGYLILKKGTQHALASFCEGYSGLLFSFASSYPDIASVDENGLISANKTGTSLIRVSVLSGAKQSVLVIVE